MNLTFGSVGLVVNRRKPGAAALAKKLKSWFRLRKKKVFEGSLDIRGVIRKSDFLVCLGGDGTMLHIAGQMTGKSIPVLGVNLGSLGFLTAVKTGEVLRELSSILDGHFNIEERIMLQVRLMTPKGTQVFQGLNDVVINRAGLTRYLRIRVKAGGEDLMSFSGDGVIVATPTGSTAYSLSAGGPFIYPLLDSLVVTPLCAHSLLARPIVLPTEKRVSVALQAEKDNGHASFTVDGQVKRVISPRDRIEISKAPVCFRLISSSHRSYLETLREKFGMVQNGR